MRSLTIILVYLGFFSGLHSEQLKFDIRGEAGILMNAETGTILFEKNSNKLHYPASTTKVATALYTLQLAADNLDLAISAPREALVSVTQAKKRQSSQLYPSYIQETDGTHIGIKTGEIFPLHDLLRGMLICSGNDAANVIAHTLGPTIPTFLQGLNAYIAQLGCKNTHFTNPHGLHDPEHVSTAYDLALMGKEFIKSPLLTDISSQTRFLRPKTNMQSATTLLQGNRLLRTGKYYYPKAIGIKTGYHARSKSTFIGAAKSYGRTLILVLLGYQNRSELYEDAIKLFDAAFNQPKIQRLFLKKGPQTFRLQLSKADSLLQTHLKENLSLDYYPAEEPQTKVLLYWNSLTLPILKEQLVGEVQLTHTDGAILQRASLFASQDIALAWPHNWLASPWLWVVVASSIILFIFLYFKKR